MFIPEMFFDLTAGNGQSDPAQFIVAGAFARGLPKIGDPLRSFETRILSINATGAILRRLKSTTYRLVQPRV